MFPGQFSLGPGWYQKTLGRGNLGGDGAVDEEAEAGEGSCREDALNRSREPRGAVPGSVWGHLPAWFRGSGGRLPSRRVFLLPHPGAGISFSQQVEPRLLEGPRPMPIWTRNWSLMTTGSWGMAVGSMGLSMR